MIVQLLLSLAVAATLVGCVAVILGAWAVRRFAAGPAAPPRFRPPVTVLKPLCGQEPMLEAALGTLCAQSYPGMQIVFGVQDPADPALRAVEAVRRDFPGVDIAVVADPKIHGPNRKISNLMNMLPAARHEVLILSDSDLHVPPDYVERIVAALERPGIGLVTTLCTGLPTSPGLVSRLGATAISHTFLPGALLARALGREDCLGTTMAIRRDTLDRAGGLAALVGHVADDHVLAQHVKQVGLGVGLAAVIPGTGVPERTFAALYQHELRWARTIRVAEPWLFFTSALQFPLFWSIMAIVLGEAANWTVALFAGAWVVRAFAAASVDRDLQLSVTGQSAPTMLLPARDLASGWLVVASYLGRRVVWRGCVMQVGSRRRGPLPVGLDRASGPLIPGDHAAAAGNPTAPGR